MSGVSASDWPDDRDVPKMELLAAAYEGNKDKVSDLLKSGVCVDAADDDGVTALHIAAFMGHDKLLQFLLEQNADIDRTSTVGMSAFHHACREGRITVLDALLQRGARQDQVTGMGATALTLAAAGGHMEIVKRLVTQSAEVSPLHGLCPTPLIAAAFRSWPQICGFLVHRGAAVDMTMESLLGLSALSCTIMCSSSTVVLSALLDLRADPYKQTMKKKTALEIASQFHKNDAIEILRNTSKRYPTARPNDMRELIRQNRLDEFQLRGKVDLPISDACTPLTYAIAVAQRPSIRKILDCGASVNVPEPRMGLSPLQIAALLRLDDVCHTIAASGAHTYLNSHGMSAFDYYIAFFGDPNPQLRMALHFCRQAKEGRVNLAGSSSSLSSLLPSTNKSKELLSMMRSSMMFNTEKSNEIAVIDPLRWKEARMHTYPMEGRNQKKLVLVQEILYKTRLPSPCRQISYDSDMDVVRSMAAEATSFMVNCFYDYYNSSTDKTETDSSNDTTIKDYDLALTYSAEYGYQGRQRSMNPRDSFNLAHKRDCYSVQESFGSMDRRKPKTTPRLLKKEKEAIPDRSGSRNHDPLRKQSSTPIMFYPTVVPTPSSSQSRLTKNLQRKSQVDMLTTAVYDSLRSMKMDDVIVLLQEAEIDGPLFVGLRQEDFVQIGIRNSETLRRIMDVQNSFDYAQHAIV